MTQLELPQVSLSRYLDLLKRRRWQVIPASLLGLMVGGLIAFFVPRYYVAETQITYNGLPDDESTGNVADPMAEVVDNAKLTIPQAVEATLEALGWQGEGQGPMSDDDLYAWRQYGRAVRRRVELFDQNPRQRRKFAVLLITYRDREGVKAAKFLNKLIEIWRERQIESIKESATDALNLASDRIGRAQESQRQLAQEVTAFERRHGLDPSLRGSSERGERTTLAMEMRDAGRALSTAQADVERLEAELLTQRAARDSIGKMRPVAPIPQAELLLLPELQAYAARYLYARRAVETIGEAHPARASREKELAEIEAEIKQIVGQLGLAGAPGGPTEVANPDYLAVLEEIRNDEAELSGAVARRNAAASEVAALEARIEALTGLWTEYHVKTEALAEADEALDQARQQGRDAEAVLDRIVYQRPIAVDYDAIVPPTPTEPNITLVALGGCLVGLGAAIGLILALDVLRGTYKTVDDVDRGLAVPVLGAMAYMETEENRARTKSSRRKIVLIAAGFLAMVVVIVTIYYVDATRLPSFVRDLMDVVLGDRVR